ncbi:hypothetical protein HK096_001795, partial [Nowakowskiella sp. JEL0078]
MFISAATKISQCRSQLLQRKNTVSSAEQFTPLRMYHEEFMKLSAWLKPLDEEMRLEREKLMRAHVRGTRSWLLVKILDFINQKSTSKDDRVLWLRGSAGVGKSVSAAL